MGRCCGCRCQCKRSSWEDVDVDENETRNTSSTTTSTNQPEKNPHENETGLGQDQVQGDVPVPAGLAVIGRSSKTLSTSHVAVFEEDDPEFNILLDEAEAAIEKGILPERIYQGSSGSYFVKDRKGDNIGVFKPRDEEPYGKNNPKWGKWFQRHCCPCCFGRGCLIPNTGYLSEAGAYIIDFRLGLNVVPRTHVIRMASSTFHYGRIKRKAAKAKKNLADRFPAVGKRFNRIGLPLKIGSFQVFVKGYKDAVVYTDEFVNDPPPHDVATEFQLEFERLVILDYVIRNTDRGIDNWLIRYDKQKEDPNPDDLNHESSGIPLGPFSCSKKGKKARIKIAAIDNGLAFPFKHPDEWRAYPFRWAKLPFAKTPFSEATRNKFLPALSNISLIEQICNDLYFIFSLDKHFKKSLFDKQMSVLRGQILNLANALREGKSPLELVQMPPVRVVRGTRKVELTVQVEKTSMHRTSSSELPRIMKLSPTNTLMFDGDEYKPEFPHEAPVFSSW